MVFVNELELENYIRKLIDKHVTKEFPHIYALKNKKAVDILICRDGEFPDLFFLEVKYHQASHGRLGFGSREGGGFQPEIVMRKPNYFESHLRWIVASAEYPDQGVLFVPSETIRRYVSGGEIGEKFNNIQERIFRENTGMQPDQLVDALRAWLLNT